MIATSVFASYARSLVDVVFEKNVEAEVTRDLFLYRDIFQAAPEVLDAFHNPAVPRDAKKRVLDELLARYPAGQIAANFFHVLLDHNRIRYFQEILDRYTNTLNERKGIVSARVTSASPLSEAEVVALRESLVRTVGRAVTLSVRTDQELLGGLVVQVGSTVYDGSIRRQLAEMRQRLMGLVPGN
jgi:F-type H+-transporting ATPase subunit delta